MHKFETFLLFLVASLLCGCTSLETKVEMTRGRFKIPDVENFNGVGKYVPEQTLLRGFTFSATKSKDREIPMDVSNEEEDFSDSITLPNSKISRAADRLRKNRGPVHRVRRCNMQNLFTNGRRCSGQNLFRRVRRCSNRNLYPSVRRCNGRSLFPNTRQCNGRGLVRRVRRCNVQSLFTNARRYSSRDPYPSVKRCSNRSILK